MDGATECYYEKVPYSYFNDKQVKTNRGQKQYIDLTKQAKRFSPYRLTYCNYQFKLPQLQFFHVLI